MSPKPHLLYLSPVLPATSGNGLAMRAGTVLGALAERYRVSLLVVPLYASPEPTLPTAIAERCEQVGFLPSDLDRSAGGDSEHHPRASAADYCVAGHPLREDQPFETRPSTSSTSFGWPRCRTPSHG